jgi:hypothetical protein
MPTSQPIDPNGTRRSVSSTDNYEDAEHAVEWLSDHEFPVERVSIVGTGLRYVEQVSGRMTSGRATLLGTGYGALIGLVWGLVFGLLFTFDSGSFWSLLGFSVLIGAVFGALVGGIGHYTTSGERDFSSSSDTRADHYEVQVEAGYAAEAQRVLSTMPAT